MSNLRGRLKSIERAAGAGRPLAGEAYAETVERHHQECAAWRAAFREGRDPGPVPVSETHPGADTWCIRVGLVSYACIEARTSGQIGQTAYLPEMSADERLAADQLCATMYEVWPDLAVTAGFDRNEPFPWPAWASFVGRLSAPERLT